jgi:hypothetical protein
MIAKLYIFLLLDIIVRLDVNVKYATVYTSRPLIAGPMCEVVSIGITVLEM